MKVKSYKELIVWQKSMTAAKEVYFVVKRLPKEESFALSDQMRRAAVSIPSNIAEGYGRDSDTEFARFLKIAHGSLTELETQLILCTNIGYLSDEDITPVMNILDEIGKMISSLLTKLNTEKNANH